jgi:hypothetical protein
VVKAAELVIVIPIPNAAASGFFGRLDNNHLAERVVNSSVDKGKAIIFGECDLTDTILVLGTAVKTKSVPDLKADSDASIGAP